MKGTFNNSVGYGQITEATAPTATGYTFIQPAWPAPYTGTITQFSLIAQYLPAAGQPFDIIQARPNADGTYTIISKTSQTLAASDAVQNFSVSIPVQVGDIMGAYTPTSAGLYAPFLGGGDGYNYQVYVAGEPSVGAAVTFSTASIFAAGIDVAYELATPPSGITSFQSPTMTCVGCLQSVIANTFSEGGIMFDASQSQGEITLGSGATSALMSDFFYNLAGGSVTPSTAWGVTQPTTCTPGNPALWGAYATQTCHVSLMPAVANSGTGYAVGDQVQASITGGNVTFQVTAVSASCGADAITSFSIASNVVTIAANNNLLTGQSVTISGLSTGTYLNGQTLTVTSVSQGGFTAAFTHANVSATTDSGSATPACGAATELEVVSAPSYYPNASAAFGLSTTTLSGSGSGMTVNLPGQFTTASHIFLAGPFQEEVAVSAVGTASAGVQSITFSTARSWDSPAGSTGAIVMQGGPGGSALVATSTVSSWPVAYQILGYDGQRLYVANCTGGNCLIPGNQANPISIPATGLPVTLFPMAFISGTLNGIYGGVQLQTNSMPVANGDVMVGAPSSEYIAYGEIIYLNQSSPSRGGAGLIIADSGPVYAESEFNIINSGGLNPSNQAIYMSGSFRDIFHVQERPLGGALIHIDGNVEESVLPYQIIQDDGAAGDGSYGFGINPSTGVWSFSGSIAVPTAAFITPPTVGYAGAAYPLCASGGEFICYNPDAVGNMAGVGNISFIRLSASVINPNDDPISIQGYQLYFNYISGESLSGSQMEIYDVFGSGSKFDIGYDGTGNTTMTFGNGMGNPLGSLNFIGQDGDIFASLSGKNLVSGFAAIGEVAANQWVGSCTIAAAGTSCSNGTALTANFATTPVCVASPSIPVPSGQPGCAVTGSSGSWTATVTAPAALASATTFTITLFGNPN